MKAKTIRQVLSGVHSKFVKSIEDVRVRELVQSNSIITGGSIVSMLLNEQVNDFDYYFTNEKTCRAVTQYYLDRFVKNTKYPQEDILIEKREDGRVKIFIRSSGIAIDEVIDRENKNIFEPICLTSNAISLTNDIQLVNRFYGDAEHIHENYDYVHAMCYWESASGELVLPQKSLEAIITKELIYSGSKYPLCSIIRSKKFINRGWTINAGQYLKMALQLNELNLMDIDVLEEQLTGVDSAYFARLIEALRNKKKSSDSHIDSSYIFELVNRIF